MTNEEKYKLYDMAVAKSIEKLYLALKDRKNKEVIFYDFMNISCDLYLIQIFNMVNSIFFNNQYKLKLDCNIFSYFSIYAKIRKKRVNRASQRTVTKALNSNWRNQPFILSDDYFIDCFDKVFNGAGSYYTLAADIYNEYYRLKKEKPKCK